MRRYGSMIVWAMVAAALPVVAAHAADATPTTPSPAVKLSSLIPAPESASSVPSQGLQLETRPSGLSYRADAPAPALRPDDFRFDFAQRQASDSALRLSPVVSTPRTGWAFSGRVGPVRWLTPIDREGETKMRFWGRVPGQPRMPGMGNFNISLHYTFE